MNKFSLSINTNPLVNRVAGAGQLIDCIAYEIRCGRVQLTPEFLNPSWPAPILRRMVSEFNAAMDRTGVKITSIMTSTFLRLNHFGHPDPHLRDYYLEWFKTLADLASDIGARSIGSQFAILTHADWNDHARRAAIIEAAVDNWRIVSEYGKNAGLSFLYWEPMSVGREFGHTIKEAASLQQYLETKQFALPMYMILDVDHGDVSSGDPDDTDPYAWLSAFSKKSPIIHIKQSSTNKSGHWPFTPEYNGAGKIEPLRLLQAVENGGGKDNELCLELAFREREPNDTTAVSALASSVAHWAPYVDTGLQK